MFRNLSDKVSLRQKPMTGNQKAARGGGWGVAGLGGFACGILLCFCFKTAEMSQLWVNLQPSGGQALACPGSPLTNMGEGLFLPSPPSSIRWNKRVSRSWLRRTAPLLVVIVSGFRSVRRNRLEKKCRTLLLLTCSRFQRRH